MRNLFSQYALLMLVVVASLLMLVVFSDVYFATDGSVSELVVSWLQGLV